MTIVSPPAPGTRVLVRDEEWLVRNADQCSAGGYELRCVGVSELVRNREAVFLASLDRIEIIDPRETELVADPSPGFRAALLYLEARLRQTVPATDELALGHQAVMDPQPSQLNPASRVVKQLRPRLLIADTVGLGKTLDWMDTRYAKVRSLLPSRRTFFEHLRALLQYLPFDDWDHLMRFMQQRPAPKATDTLICPFQQ